MPPGARQAAAAQGFNERDGRLGEDVAHDGGDIRQDHERKDERRRQEAEARRRERADERVDARPQPW